MLYLHDVEPPHQAPHKLQPSSTPAHHFPLKSIPAADESQPQARHLRGSRCHNQPPRRQIQLCSYVKQDLHAHLLQFKALGTHPGERGGSMVIEDDQISDSALFYLLDT
jgi:hypothetical protein